MKLIQKLFAVMCLTAIVGFVGCADATKTPDEGKKTPTGETDKTPHDDHDHKTPAKTAEVPTPAENPDVNKIESGSVDKKDNVDLKE